MHTVYILGLIRFASNPDYLPLHASPSLVEVASHTQTLGSSVPHAWLPSVQSASAEHGSPKAEK